MLTASKYIIITFGIFLIFAGLIMFFKPGKARNILRKAGSTNFINFTEITIRMIPAAAMIIYSDLTEFPEFFKILGWIMIITSLILYIVPRKIHYDFSQKSAEILKPIYFQMISPVSILFGMFVIYCVI